MKLDFMKERDCDILNVYDKVLKEFGNSARYQSKQEIYSKVTNSQAKQFYVSPEEAMRIISRINKGQDPGIKNPERREMYYDIHKKFVEIKNEYPAITVKDAIYRIIYSPAPRFYIKPNSLKVLFHHIQKRRRCSIVQSISI